MQINFDHYLGLNAEHLIDLNSCKVLGDGTKDMLALKEATIALCSLQQDALKNGFVLRVCSAFRSFDRQMQLFNNKFLGLKPILDHNENIIDPPPSDPIERIKAILLFSAMPGFSRHHFGSEFDIYALNKLPPGQSLKLTYHEYMAGSYFYEFGLYLQENLAKFGFANPYLPLEQDNIPQTGFEPWHISHLSSARPFLNAYDFDIARNYVSNCQCEFAPYVKQIMSDEQIFALIRPDV